jgi:DNA-binding PadR family transcriptional regulator
MRFAGGPRGGGRRRRGDVRFAILAMLEERPMHGYELIQELEARSGGRWRPSPGSIYPTLQMLEDEGLVTGEEREGRRVFSITDAGRAALAARAEEAGGAAPWDRPSDADDPFARLREAAFQLGAAAMQVGGTGTDEQVTRTLDILVEARKKIYGILAEG